MRAPSLVPREIFGSPMAWSHEGRCGASELSRKRLAVFIGVMSAAAYVGSIRAPLLFGEAIVRSYSEAWPVRLPSQSRRLTASASDSQIANMVGPQDD